MRAHVHAVEKYGYDCILIDLDTTMLAEAMGAHVPLRRANQDPSPPPRSPASMSSAG